MHLKSLSLKNVRLFSRLEMKTPRRVLLFVGGNAQGKTSILESIFYLATFSSFHTNNDRQLIRFDTRRDEKIAVAHIAAEFERGSMTHHIKVSLILQPDRSGNMRFSKEILFDNAKRKLHQVIGKFNAVLFLPEMTRIIEGSPDQRRRFLNMTISQTNPRYYQRMTAYNQALQQRNALLKIIADRGKSKGQLDIWDEKIAELGAYLIHQRISMIEALELEAQFIHSELSHGREILRFDYQPSFDPAQTTQDDQRSLFARTEQFIPIKRDQFTEEEIFSKFLEALHQNRLADIQRGTTTLGPHRDEMRFIANDYDLGDYGSRGQIRTALVSLKLAEAQWIKRVTGEDPVMLLDEVLAELDQQRRADLLRFLNNGQQAFLTTAELDLFQTEYLKHCEIRHIQGGIVSDPNQPNV
ncbi:MAG: DNA replication/repair protein RecF [Anaerolineaceae bacterium]|nr:DNA replication/repair protein RecF [Anaerolineaceae bacterium]